MIRRVSQQMRRLRPRVMDPWAFGLVSVAFGVAVMTIAHHSKSLRLDVEAANLAWVVLIGFGMSWHGEWRHGSRIGGGLVFGAAAAIAAYYGAMSMLPATPFSIGLGLGIAAASVAVITHLFPRAMSFAGAAVGFGVGVAATRALPMRPTTPADDMFALMLTAVMALVIGVGGSLVVRAVVMRMGIDERSSLVTRLLPRRRHDDLEATADLGPPVTVHTRHRVGAAR